MMATSLVTVWLLSLYAPGVSFKIRYPTEAQCKAFANTALKPGIEWRCEPLIFVPNCSDPNPGVS
jgi:hypothetical protein